MTAAEILAALTALGTIVGAGLYVFKYFTNKAEKSPAQQDADIDSEISQERQDAEKSGHP